jgi:phospholipid/cholesterol/gamma-HCH transport system permease protein
MTTAARTLIAPITALGRYSSTLVNELGGLAIFSFKSTIRIFFLPIQIKKIISQVFFIGFKSLFVIFLVSLFAGMVLGLQGYYTLVKFGSEGLLGSAVALSIIRELGPVLSALMITGRAGSSMSAELGVMRITQQIDALDVMDIDPIRFLVSPKIAGAIISFPLLTALFDTIGIFGGYISGVLLLDVNGGAYLHRIESSVSWTDVWGGFAKSLTFAVIVSVICCFEGYYTHLREDVIGAEGVSHSTTTAVVKSSIFILIADYILTSFFM